MQLMDLAASALIAFVATSVTGKFFVPFMKRKKIGQSILEIGPKWHMSKQGTPTMGGAMFIVGIFLASLILGIALLRERNGLHLAILLFALSFGLIGFLDDYVKFANKRNLGLTAIQKLILQFAAALVFISLLRIYGVVTPNLYIPFINVTLRLPWVGYMILSVLFIVGIVNAVNFTDGVDGLLTSVTLPIMVFFATAAWIMKSYAVGIVSAAAVGALCAFLIYNFNPAKIFMGDTGSLFLGGLVCGLAFSLNLPLILPVVGAIYIIELLSVVLQVSYFKISHGKRIFRMSPIHHHFEMGGWGEKKICLVFGGLTLVLCMIATAALFAMYNV